MLSLTRIQLLSFAAASALVALTAVSTPSRAAELMQYLGPVGPNEPVLTTFGDKRVIAFYEPDNGRCTVNAVVYDKTDAETGMTTAIRVRISLNPREMVHIDSADNESVKSLNLQCGKNAEMLTIRHRANPSKPVHRTFDREDVRLPRSSASLVPAPKKKPGFLKTGLLHSRCFALMRVSAHTKNP